MQERRLGGRSDAAPAARRAAGGSGCVAASLLVLAAGAACMPGDTGDPGVAADYPVVLAHGALGMQQYGPLDYWYGIVGALASDGSEVFVTEVSPLNSSIVRGEQLLSQVIDILAVTGDPKVHLIGHSQGGLDARYVAGVRPDLVASVTTIGTPHKGAALAEFLAEGINNDGTFSAAVLNLVGDLAEELILVLTGTTLPVDARAALIGLAPPGVSAFNALFPAGVPADCNEGAPFGNGIRFYSWMGQTPLTNALDPTDALLGVAGAFYLLEKNDGLVSVCSAQFGDVIRNDYSLNHLDQVNQILGLVSPIDVNPVALFRNHTSRLRALEP